MKDERIYLRHILECIEAIQDYNTQGRDTFLTDRKTCKATLRELQELAESTQRLSVALQESYPEIPWPAHCRISECAGSRLSGTEPEPNLGNPRAGLA